MQELQTLYKATFGHAPLKVETLAKAGSNRQYVRMTAPAGHTPASVIGVVGTAVEENRTFIYLSQHFRAQGLPVPEAFSTSPTRSMMPMRPSFMGGGGTAVSAS